MMRGVLGSLCAASLVLPLPLRAAPEPTTPATSPSPPVTEAPPADEGKPTPSDVAAARSDDLHDAMVRAFTERFQEGKFLYNRGSYTQAAAEFERAFASIPAEAALFNVVISYERARDLVSAALAARRYLALPACDTPEIDPALCSAQRDDVAARLERLMAQIGELTLEVAKGVSLREIGINGRTVAIDDFPVLVAAGRIDVELVGAVAGQRRQRVIDVRPGEQQEIYVGPFDQPDPVRDNNDGRTREPKLRPPWLRPFFWTSLGLTVGAGVATATMAGLMRREVRIYDREICDEVCIEDKPYPLDHERRAARYREVTNALIGVTAGLAAISLVVGAIAFTGKTAPRRRNGSTQRASTRVHWTGPGLVLRW